MIGDLRGLARGDERADRNQAPISRRQGRTQRKVMKKFTWLDPVIECRVEMVGHLDRLIVRDKADTVTIAAVPRR